MFQQRRLILGQICSYVLSFCYHSTGHLSKSQYTDTGLTKSCGDIVASGCTDHAILLLDHWYDWARMCILRFPHSRRTPHPQEHGGGHEEIRRFRKAMIDSFTLSVSLSVRPWVRLFVCLSASPISRSYPCIFFYLREKLRAFVFMSYIFKVYFMVFYLFSF